MSSLIQSSPTLVSDLSDKQIVQPASLQTGPSLIKRPVKMDLKSFNPTSTHLHSPEQIIAEMGTISPGASNIKLHVLCKKHVLPSGAIWFQCPWREKDVNGLISNFLLDVSDKVRENTLVLIGITRHGMYVSRYKLQTILGTGLMAKDNSTDCLKKYKFLGADDDLIKDILSFGYLHMGISGKDSIHNNLRDYHVTLVFKKKASESVGDLVSNFDHMHLSK